MNESVFRQKSIDRVSSPERVDEYIHVTRPSILLIVIATIILVIGIAMWTAYVGLDAVIEDMGVDDFVELFSDDE